MLDLYKGKGFRKEPMPSPKIENPKHDYNRRDKSWLHKTDEGDVESFDEEMDRELGKGEPEHFNLEEFNRKLREEQAKKYKK